MLWSDTIPIVHAKDQNGKTTQIKIVAGDLQDNKAPTGTRLWAANPSHEVAIWIIHMEPYGMDVAFFKAGGKPYAVPL